MGFGGFVFFLLLESYRNRMGVCVRSSSCNAVMPSCVGVLSGFVGFWGVFFGGGGGVCRVLFLTLAIFVLGGFGIGIV